jgi:hypothetical protein
VRNEAATILQIEIAVPFGRQLFQDDAINPAQQIATAQASKASACHAKPAN